MKTLILLFSFLKSKNLSSYLFRIIYLLKSFIKSNKLSVNYSQCFENIVYNELINKGYKVYVGKTNKGEIDFIATKDKSVKYIQACYDLTDDKTREREFGAYEYINDNYPKYVISKNKEDYSQNGIIHLNIFKFLMDDEF